MSEQRNIRHPSREALRRLGPRKRPRHGGGDGARERGRLEPPVPARGGAAARAGSAVLRLQGFYRRGGCHPARTRPWPCTSPGAALHLAQSGHHGQRSAQHPADHEAEPCPRSDGPRAEAATWRRFRGRADRRQRLLTLTVAGQALERRLYERQRDRLTAAYREAGGAAVEGFRRVMRGIMNESARAYLDANEAVQARRAHRG